MCGIGAIIGASLPPFTQARGERMIRAMRHRGPNASGVAHVQSGMLAHCRLSILDTSANGAQPMARNGVTIVYNGECYNFAEMRAELQARGHTFTSGSDTEVLVAMYLEYGPDFVQRLRGIFSFVLHDSRDNSFLCARDHLGVKPLLYTVASSVLVIASELRALFATGLVPMEVDRQDIYTLIRNGSIQQPRTAIKGVSMLMPGHLLHWRGGVASIRRYWHMATGRRPDLAGLSPRERQEAGRELVTRTLRQQMVSDVPLGAFLSGGIDSSLLVALMREVHEDVHTFSIGFESGLDTASEDESADALEVARHLGTKHSNIIISRREIVDVLPRIAADLDHPTVDGVNSWFVSRAASSALTVAISGTGGDELFCGYPWFAAMNQPIPAYAPWRRLLRRLRGREDFLTRYSLQYFINCKKMATSLMPGHWIEPTPDDPLAQAGPLERVSGLTLSGYTRNQLLPDIDTASMAHSLEVRVPFLDVDLLDFALSLPQEAKLGPGDPAAPEHSYARTGVKRLLVEMGAPLLPPGFANRAKRGFTLPFDGWLRDELAEMCRDLLAPTVVKKRGFFEHAGVSTLLHDFEQRRVGWPQIWVVMMSELWARQVLDTPHDSE